ncbi:helix-turn-helix domain-containing protein [Streptomyces termitum]|uniref:helix-turn-helix domain-containing protein n=1 Tax=Streptomyces termitum TaxID=67368 RepID=UPI00379FE1F5
MSNIKTLHPENGPAAAYGARVRSTREERGWTQEDLADRTGYSSKHISAVETSRRSSTLRFSQVLDVAFGLTGSDDAFEREWMKLRHGVLLEGFPQYVHHERQAIEIRLFDIGIAPGLLQTAAYARALAYGDVRRGSINSSQADERCAVLAKRQATVTGDRPPIMHVVIDESCIRRPVGGATVTGAQLDRLLEFAELPHTTLQVAPYAIGELRPFNLPVNLLTLADRSMLAYTESHMQGHLARETTTVATLLTAYYQLQAESLSQADSMAMIREARKAYP